MKTVGQVIEEAIDRSQGAVREYLRKMLSNISIFFAENTQALYFWVNWVARNSHFTDTILADEAMKIVEKLI